MADPDVSQFYVTPGDSSGLPDVPLYHYTDRNGFLGILGTGSLWATDVLYLNDAEEIAYGRRLINDAMKRHAASSPFRERFDDVLRQAVHEREVAIYVVCFSEIDDDLSQWRAYGHGGGCALMFPPASFREFALRSGSVAKVVYDRSLQDALAEVLVREFEGRSQRIANWTRDISRRETLLFTAAALLVAARLKHPKFAEEKEWRVIHTPGGVADTLFRVSKSMLTPYRAIAIDPSGSISDSLDVVVGPTAHPELVARSARQLVAAKLSPRGDRALAARIRTSAVPYRDW